MRLFGIDCEIFDVASTSMYLDDRTLRNGIPYKMLPSEYTDSRLLSNLKWSTTDTNTTSLTVLMPIQYNNRQYNLREFEVIRVCNGDTYQVREVNKTYLIGLWYVVKLITYEEEKNRPRTAKQMKTNFLKTDKEEIA